MLSSFITLPIKRVLYNPTSDLFCYKKFTKYEINDLTFKV